MGEKKEVRMLLRVSSNQQLEEDGVLGIQRQLVKEFIAQHEEWHSIWIQRNTLREVIVDTVML